MFFKIGVLKNFSILTGKQTPVLEQSYSKEIPNQVFSNNYYKIFNTSFFFIGHLQIIVCHVPQTQVPERLGLEILCRVSKKTAAQNGPRIFRNY